MKKVLKGLGGGLVWIISIVVIIVFSPIILAMLLIQVITQPFEKKKFFASGFDKFTSYSYGVTHTVSFHIYEAVKKSKFDLIVNAFAGLDLYIFEKGDDINFLLSGDFDEYFYFSTEDNEWIYSPQHGNFKDSNGKDPDCFNPFEEMRIIKNERFGESNKNENYYICLDSGFEKSLQHKGDKTRFRHDKRFVPLFEVFLLTDRTEELNAKGAPEPPLSPETIYTVWAEDKQKFCEVTKHDSGAFVYNAMMLDYDEYSNQYYWFPTGNSFASYFDTAEKAKQAAEDFLQGK